MNLLHHFGLVACALLATGCTHSVGNKSFQCYFLTDFDVVDASGNFSEHHVMLVFRSKPALADVKPRGYTLITSQGMKIKAVKLTIAGVTWLGFPVRRDEIKTGLLRVTKRGGVSLTLPKEIDGRTVEELKKS